MQRINPDAADALVADYKQLRIRDASGAALSSWRVTVRQLESMIRLSEAVARLYCSAEVTPNHIKETYRLLNKSIIRIEQPDVDFNEESMQVEPNGDPMETDLPDEDVSSSDQMTRTKPTLKLTLTFDEYKNLLNLLILRIRQEDERRATDDDSGSGLRKSELIGWYLQQAEDEIETEDELINKKSLAEKVIDRLIRHDNILIQLTKTLDGPGHVIEEEDPILVVHPNYVFEDEI